MENDYETIAVKLSLRSKLRPPGAKSAQNFEFITNVEHRFGKLPLSKYCYSYIELENEIRKGIKFPSHYLRQIWPSSMV